MSNTPIESPRTARSTPPTSSRGFNSARGASSIAAKYVSMAAAASSRTPIGFAAGLGVPRTPRTPMTPRVGHDAGPAVQVVVRVKPPEASGPGNVSSAVACTVERSSSGESGNQSSKLVLVGPSGDGQGDEQREYEFSDVFDQAASDSSVNASIVQGIVDHVKNGYSACVLCYGQTGSGKTHTMQHLTQALLEAVFHFLRQENVNTAAVAAASSSSSSSLAVDDPAAAAGLIDDPAASSVVEMSYLQVYNNNVFNLLAPEKGMTRGGGEYGEVLPRPKGHLIVEPYTIVSSAGEVRSRLAEAQKRRVITPHSLNPRSSRSHTLFSLRLTKCVDGTPVQSSKITLTDLAGCERVKKSGVAGEGLDEAIAINKSLSALHGVIKAISAEAEVLIPFRESLLTLYLKPSIVDAYLVLVTTISLDSASFSETKSSLDFATTAKRCVVSRARATTSDRLLRRGTIEAANAELQREIETLRNHVDVLQRTVALEKSRKNRLEGQSGVLVPPEMELLRDRIAQIEQHCASFQKLLRDREEELAVLDSRRALAEDIRKELEMRQQERDDARAALAASGGGIDSSSAALSDSAAAVGKLLESFLWLEEQHSAALESMNVLEKQFNALQADHRHVVSEVLAARQANLDWEMRFGEASVMIESLNAEAAELRRKYDASELQMLRERNERAIREDTIVLYNGAVARAVDVDRVKKALDEQRALCDVIQARLSSAERELDASEVARMKLEESARGKDDTLRSLFALLTPQQKARLMQQDLSVNMAANGPSGGGGQQNTGGHVVQTYDAVQMRAQNRELQRQLSELQLRVKDREFHIEDLEHDKRNLEELYRNLNNDYLALQKLDEQHSDRQVQLEEQLTDLYAYIEAHAARQQLYESRISEARQEWDRLDDEYKQAQRVINELTMRLDRASEDLKLKDADKDLLTARLKEAEAERTTIARMRAEDRAKLTELERQLQLHQTHSSDVARRLDLAEKGRQHLVTEIQHHNTHGDLLQRRLVSLKLPPETVKKHVQKLRHVDPAIFAPPAAMTMDKIAENIAKVTNAGRYRFEVSQIMRQHGGSTGSGPTTAAAPSSSAGKSRHVDTSDMSLGKHDHGGSSPIHLAPILTSNPVVVGPGGVSKRVSPMNVGRKGPPLALWPVVEPSVVCRKGSTVDVPSLASIHGRPKEVPSTISTSAQQQPPPPPPQTQQATSASSPPAPPKMKPEIPKLPIATPLSSIAIPQRRGSLK